MAGTQAILQWNTLALAAFADAFYYQLFGHRTGQFGTVVTGQYRQQQVEYRHAAAGGEAITVPVEQMAGGNDLGEPLGEIVLPAPVHGGAVAIEQAQLGQRVHTRRQAADYTPCPNKLLERGTQWRSDDRRRFVGQQEQLLKALQLTGPRLARQLPGTFDGGLGEQKRQLVDHIRMHPLGNAQGLLSQRKRKGFCAGPNQETNFVGGHGVLSKAKTVKEAVGQC